MPRPHTSDRRAKLAAQIAAAGLVSAVAAALFTIGLLAAHEAYQAGRARTASQDRYKETVAERVAEALEAEDPTRAAAWLELLEGEAGVAAARIVSPDGSVSASWGEADLFARNEQRLSVVALGERTNLGRLEVIAAAAPAAASARDMAVAAFALAISIAAAASIGLLLARRIARPFERTAEELRELAADGDARLPARGAAELRDISAYVNGLLADVHGRGASVDRLVEQLREARDLADAASAAKTRFLAHMSHELRTPLNAIMGYTKFVSEDLQGPEHEQSRDDLARVTRASEHLLSLINQVLDLSKIEAGGVELELGGFDVGALLRHAVETSSPLAAKNRNVLELSECPKGEVIVSDALRLRQCVLNVLGNALKFTEDGRVEVKASVAKTEGARIFTCEIKDTGPGIPEDKVAAVFEPFVQVDDTQAKRQGTGLGLAITKRLCLAMGGDIVCASTLGRGSTFTITVRDQADAAAKRAA